MAKEVEPVWWADPVEEALMNMRTHLWLHGGLAIAVLGVLGLSALGVAIPGFVTYLIVLACPAMILVMMLGMSRAEAGHDSRAHDHPSATPPAPAAAPDTVR